MEYVWVGRRRCCSSRLCSFIRTTLFYIYIHTYFVYIHIIIELMIGNCRTPCRLFVFHFLNATLASEALKFFFRIERRVFFFHFIHHLWWWCRFCCFCRCVYTPTTTRQTYHTTCHSPAQRTHPRHTALIRFRAHVTCTKPRFTQNSPQIQIAVDERDDIILIGH